jgi:hypothetical protein
MTDNLGLNQTRVLDSSNRSFEAVIFQKKKPPLSCEWNLEGNLVAEHSQDVSQLVGPSGWVSVGYINDNTIENTARVGDVITSPNYPANSFKLMATDQGVLTGTLSAWVNGMKVLVQGTNSLTDENNLIQLGAPPTTAGRVDFVFLEVWRKLIGVSDVVYSHGNVLYGGVNYINDLVDPAVNVETSLRIQVQYRIRVVSDVDIGTFPEGFGPNVYAQGPLLSPSTCTGANFTQVPGDPGLWRAGLGDSASQETLNTVDGYTYAIPMFAVTRRNTNAFSNAHVNGAGFALADYLNGVISDRPDNLYNNWIVADDIMDMRKTIKADNLKETCNKAFQKLINGDLRGVMSYQNIGEGHYGDVLMQVDGINSLPNPGWFTNIGTGNGIQRVFSSASVLQNRTLVCKDPPGGTWTDPFTITPSFIDPPGTLVSLLAIWDQTSANQIPPNAFSTSPSGFADSVLITPTTTPFHGASDRITISYAVQYPSGGNGLSALPTNVYETRRSDSTIAFPPVGSTILLHGSFSMVYADETFSNTVSVPGTDPTTLYNFGAQMTYYVASSGANTFTVPRNIMGYEILGVISVFDPIGISPKDLSLSTAVSRGTTEYTVTYGGIAIDAGQPIRVVLYLGASNINSTVMSKFFQTNNQGKSITNIYEMREIQATSITSTSFFVDTTTEEILALASGLDLGGAGIAYDSNGIRCLTQITNASLPMPTGDAQTDATCSRLYIDFAIAPATPITVPVLVSSPLISSDSYQIYYKTIPYQGLLNNSGTHGTIEVEGPALITTSGSGTITPSFKPENIIDRLPTLYSSNDAMALNEKISTAVSDLYPVLETRIISRPQDIIDKPAGSAMIGLYPAGRGRSGVSVSDSTYLGLKFEKLDATGSYQKTYQSYILNKESKGELYLMVVGSETGNDSSSQYLGSSDDSVDIFQLPGRPIKNGKNI